MTKKINSSINCKSCVCQCSSCCFQLLRDCSATAQTALESMKKTIKKLKKQQNNKIQKIITLKNRPRVCKTQFAKKRGQATSLHHSIVKKSQTSHEFATLHCHKIVDEHSGCNTPLSQNRLRATSLHCSIFTF